jgi:hypothetical protein
MLIQINVFHHQPNNLINALEGFVYHMKLTIGYSLMATLHDIPYAVQPAIEIVCDSSNDDAI